MTGLEYLLKLKSITQNDLANSFNTSRQNINTWVRGKQSLPKKYIKDLEIFFDISSEYILKKNLSEVDKVQIKMLLAENEDDKVSSDIELQIEKILALLKFKLSKINNKEKIMVLYKEITLLIEDDNLNELKTNLAIAVKNENYILAGDIQKKINRLRGDL